MIGSAPVLPPIPESHGHDPVEMIVLSVPGGGDARVELAGSAPAEIAHTSGALVALGDDVAGDAKIVADAKRLAAALGGAVVGGREAARVGAISAGGVLDKRTAIAPELCVQVGAVPLELAGASCVIRIGGRKRADTSSGAPSSAGTAKAVDGSIDGSPGDALAELVERLELPL
jgi:hypothetical protein